MCNGSPHTTGERAVGEVIEFKAGLAREAAPLFSDNLTPPRKEFGRRRPQLSDLSGGFSAAWRAATAEDDAAQRRIKAAARAARDMNNGVHPDLLRAFAAKLEHMAFQASQLAQEARFLKRDDERVTLENIADILETRAAILEGAAK